ncbi:ATP-binding protein [Vibrio genomosp. F10]|uniref:histidine kinase n=1 Tax=Vibrio genomosp. F10 TaxID=723171 RepID=A0A1B9QZZ1_9VIBR|nr:ATP-binding protein [Vibrio genomosp. F10]OCH77129.1 two-component sensor histidine kinase [Vibrio genomosp. F10]OEF08994.1 two-component sensor histidine kinase [Vibrio genomosp. F10 str. 9ZD137]
MNKWSTIGAKLVLAFTGTTILLTVVSVVAWLTWNQLDDQVSELLEQSVPKYNTSYLLESRSGEIRYQVQLLPTITNMVELNDQIATLSTLIESIKRTLSDHNQGGLNDVGGTNLAELYLDLENTLGQYSDLVLHRVEQTRKINQLKEQLNWLNQDIDAELMPIRQELHWLIERYDAGERRNNAFEQLRTIQQILDLESSVFTIISDVMDAQQLGQVHNAAKVVQYKLNDLSVISEVIVVLPTAIAYQQLLEELTGLLSPEGAFYSQILDKVSTNQRINGLNHRIDFQLNEIHQQIGQLVGLADESFVDVKKKTARLVSYGNHVLLVCFSVSILMSLFLTYYFINRRIVARLTALSTSIDAITRGDLSYPIKVDGQDEIGRISEKLIEYGESVKEIQRTNAVSLINNTSASLLTCDLVGNVESLNLSARRLLATDEDSGHKPIWEILDIDNPLDLARIFSREGKLRTHGQDELTFSVGHAEPCYLHFDFHQFSHGQLNKIIITITNVTQQELTARELEKLVDEKTHDLIEKNQRLSKEVSERELAERNLKQTQGELIQAAKMAVVGQTMTSLAHELNQPLNAMSTYLYSAKLSSEGKDIVGMNQALHQVDVLANRMNKVITSLRSFAKKPDGDQAPESLHIHHVVEQAMSIVNTKAKRQMITLENRVEPDLRVAFSALALEQVLINVMVNGCDAVSESNPESRNVSIYHLYSSPNYHTIAIEDNGNGFEPDIVSKLFTPFTTTKEVGLGLGLSISRSLIEKYSGHIYLGSSVNRGALVLLELPYDLS